MDPFDDLAADYESGVEPYARMAGGSVADFVELRLVRILELLGSEPPDRVLDFGCGVGIAGPVLRRAFPSAEIVGIDTSERSIERARSQQIPRSSWHSYPGGPMPFDDGSFDVVYTNGTIHHIPPHARAEAFSEIRRVLRPGGSLFVFENNPANLVMAAAMWVSPIDADAVLVWPRSLRRWIREASLSVQRTEYQVFFPARLHRFERRLRRVPVGAQYLVWAQRPR